MAHKSVVPLLGAAALAAAFPVAAQDSGLDRVTPVQASSGYQTEIASGGFQLVTHGMWRLPDSTVQSIVPAVAPPVVEAPNREQRAIDQSPSFRRTAWLPHVYAAEARYRLPRGLLDALIWTESRYNPLAVSRAGAAGLGQLMPRTAQELGVTNRFEPRASVTGAARYLKQMLDRFGVVHLALAAYNAGPGAVEQAGGIPRNGETPAYVRRVLDFWRAR